MSLTLREMETEQRFAVEDMQDKMGKIHNKDCLSFMKQVPDNYFDLVLTDPPYGINASSNSLGLRKEHKHKRTWEKKEWDKGTPAKEVFDEMIRISKNQIIWGGNYFELKPCKNYIVWDKKISGNVPFAHCEMAWTSYFNAPTIFRLGIQSLDEDRVHPTQKPIKLFDYCLREAGDIKTVFDPFMGSGTTAIACKSLGLDWCGCELEADYVEIANKRLEQVQLSLF